MVETLGVKAADIPTALITHLHWDHWAGHSLFPAAEFWIQKEEIAFWTGPVARYDAYKVVASAPSLAALVRMSYAHRVRVVEGEREAFPGLSVRWLGGHTAGLQIVTVETAKGRIVLTSDAAQLRHDPRPGRRPLADRRRPRSGGRRAVQAARARDRADRMSAGSRTVLSPTAERRSPPKALRRQIP
jgi:glyoxylase-like metal-dependent hydrolase (beta-lactamase superfamily II)